jgi:hypothetical protein
MLKFCYRKGLFENARYIQLLEQESEQLHKSQGLRHLTLAVEQKVELRHKSLSLNVLKAPLPRPTSRGVHHPQDPV